MKKKFLFNLILLVFLNLIIKPFWVFGIDRTVQNIVGSSEYGMLFALFNLSVILNIILDLGITNFNNRHISQQPQSFRVFFPNIVAVKIILTIVYAIIVFSTALAIGYDKRQLMILLLLVANQAIISFTLYLRSNISGMQYYTTDSILSVSDRVIMISACIIGYYSYFNNHTISIEWFVIVQTISYLISTVIVFIVLISKTGFTRFRLKKTVSLTILKAGLPYALLILLMSTYSRIDSVMLERLLENGKEQAGIYAQSFRIIDSVTMLPILFAGLLLPMFSNLFGKKEDISPLTSFAFRLLWVIAVAFSLASAFNAQPIIELLYKQGSNYSSNIFTVLILSFLPVSVIFIYSTIITAGGNLKWLNIFAFISVIINISLNLILIPEFKAMGAAISSLITQCFMAISQIVIVKKQFGNTFADKIKIVSFTATAFATAVALHYFTSNWIWSFCLIGICITLLGLAFKLLPLNKTAINSLLTGHYQK